MLLNGHKKNNNCFQYIILTILLVIQSFFISACDPNSRQKILTFFFTGVPPLVEDNDLAFNKEGKEKNSEDIITPQKDESEEGPIFFEHPHYTARQCDKCHNCQALFVAPGASSKPRSYKFRVGGGMPGELLLPKSELCQKCHMYLASELAIKDGFWVHGPVAQGCNSCHDSHQSEYPFMLFENPDNFCQSCHAKGFILESDAHKKDEKCLTCHNPHLGKDRFLLKNVYKEIKVPVGPFSGLPKQNVSN